MYAHITTHHLGLTADAIDEITWADENGEVISDQTARTIASWWQSPATTCQAITALSHGRPFDTDELLAEIPREVEDLADATALMSWAVHLADHLADG